MPIAINRLPDQDLTVFTASGTLTYREQLEVLEDFYHDGPSLHVIWDFSEVTGSRISSEQLEDIIAFLGRHSNRRRGGKTALVAPSDLDFGLSRMGTEMARLEELPLTLESFRTIAEARAWLEQDSGP